MPVPSYRVPVRVARGTKAALDSGLASLEEGEICYATDENALYVVEGGVLTAAGSDVSAASIGDLSDVDTTTSAPTDGQVLIWNNVDGEWQPGDSISDVVSDTTPQLGGNLDVNGNQIVSAGGGDIEIAPDTTGGLVVRGNSTDGKIKLNCTANTHGVTIQSPPHADAATYSLILPSGAGTAGQVLTSQGGAQLTWEDAGTGGGATSIDDLTDVDTSTTAPTNGQVLEWDGTNWVPADATGGGGSASLDPLFSAVTVLTPFDNETNGASTWTSYGSTSPVWTANSSTISNTLTRWGGTTSLDAGAGGPSLPCSLGTDDWTIEMWVYFDQGSWNNFGSFIRNGLLSDTYDAFYFGPNGNSSSTRFRLSNSGSDLLTVSGSCTWYSNEWNHIAACRSGNSYSAYVNGEKVGSGVLTGRTFNSGDIVIDGSSSTTAYIQDFRITSGVARYTTSFYPVPAFPMPVS